MLEADVIELPEHVFEKADLPLIGGSKVRVPAFRPMRHVTGSVPGEECLAQPGARRDDCDCASGNSLPGVNRLHVAWPQNRNGAGNRFEIVD